MDDSYPPNATNFNVAGKALLDRTANLDWRLIAQVANFSSPVSPWGFARTSEPAWDAVGARWLVGKGNDNSVQASYDGLSWTKVGGSLSAAPSAIAVRSFDGVASLIKAGNSTMACLTPATAPNEAWSEFTGPNWSTNGVQQGTWFAGGGGLFVFWESRANTPTRLFTASDGIHFGADLGASLPAAFTAGASASQIGVAQSPTMLLLFAASPQSTAYVFTTDGVTWTNASIPQLSPTESVGAVTWASDGSSGRFVVAVVDLSNQKTRFVVSPSGLTGSWNEVGSINHVVWGMVATGTGLAIVAVIRGQFRTAISIDGISWRLTRLAPNGTGGLLYSAGGAYLLYADALGFTASANAGLPPSLQL